MSNAALARVLANFGVLLRGRAVAGVMASRRPFGPRACWGRKASASLP